VAAQPGLNLVLRMDGFAWLFSMLVLGIGTLVSLYARYYMSPDDPVPRFFAFFLAFMGAMLGLVISGNLIQLVFFWELTSLFSFLLIGYWHHRADARRGAYMALMVTGAGGLCLLAGSCCSAMWSAAMTWTRSWPPATDPPACAVPGAAAPDPDRRLSKSAQFPSTSGCPTPWRRPPRCRPTCTRRPWSRPGCFCWHGCGRCCPAAKNGSGSSAAPAPHPAARRLRAMFQNDLKGLLAYSTISHLGLITLLLGLNSPLAAVAAVFHILNHATFKASLFMAAGIIDHESGTRDIRRSAACSA
jgi:multicomponent K+:H+ antiporter subunit A